MANDEKTTNMENGRSRSGCRRERDTLGHYEKMGLLPTPNRTQGGYRLYPPDTLARAQLIQRAVRVGFTLPELVKVLKQRRLGGAPYRKVAELAARHIEDLNRKIVDLTQLREWFATTFDG